MSLDLHPEDLLDKWSKGSIAADEKRRLDEHLELCAVCRFESKARADFRVEGDVAPADLDAMVSQALGSLASEKKAAAAEIPRRRLIPKSAFLLVAAIALLSVEAIAGKWSAGRDGASAKKTVVDVSAIDDGSNVASTQAQGQSGGKSAAKTASALIAASPADMASAATAMVPPAGELALAPAPVSPTFASVVARDVNASSSPAGSAYETAPMIFSRANKERTAGDHAKARAAYATLFRRFPLSSEGMIAHATLGRMLLDDGDAAPALIELDTYLAQGDTALREPVLAARATALGRLGRTAAEVEAWNRLLDEYPSSLYASRARARIDQVAAR